MIVCLCKGISDRELKRAISSGATSARALRRANGAGSCCGACKPEIAELLAQAGTDRTLDATSLDASAPAGA